MNYRLLGRTGLKVSELALGTVSLGADYGLRAPDGYGRPDAADALRVLQAAADAGINLFDTAPGYGDAERLVGEALGARHDCWIATKVSVPATGQPVRETIQASLQASCRALRRGTLDLVQIHNATADVLRQGEMLEVLDHARQAGQIRFIGVSVYTEEEALAAIRTGRVDMLQVAYSILDQRKTREVFPAARAAGVGILTRSALLKGVLSGKATHLPSGLSALRDAADKARRWLGTDWAGLPAAALRFCLDSPGIDSVLIGPRTLEELHQSLAVLALAPIPPTRVGEAAALGLEEDCLVNPARWPAL